MAACIPYHSCTQGKLLQWHHRLTVPHTLKSGGLTHEDFRLRHATHCNTSVASVPELFRYCAAGISDYSYIQQRTPPESHCQLQYRYPSASIQLHATHTHWARPYGVPASNGLHYHLCGIPGPQPAIVSTLPAGLRVGPVRSTHRHCSWQPRRRATPKQQLVHNYDVPRLLPPYSLLDKLTRPTLPLRASARVGAGAARAREQHAQCNPYMACGGPSGTTLPHRASP